MTYLNATYSFRLLDPKIWDPLHPRVTTIEAAGPPSFFHPNLSIDWPIPTPSFLGTHPRNWASLSLEVLPPLGLITLKLISEIRTFNTHMSYFPSFFIL